MKIETVLRNLSGQQTDPVIVAENQSVRDIINLIKLKHIKCAADYDRIAPHFWAGSVRATAKRLFDFCKQYISYEIESEEWQTISSPAKILERRYGDCKHYSLFIAGVLDALNREGYAKINWFYRFASYNPFDDSPGHVFVIIKNPDDSEIWIDPVLSEFDRHKIFQYAIDKKIKTTMQGIGMVHHRYGTRLGLSAMTPLQCIGATGQQTGQLVMKVAPALAAVPVVGWVAAAGGEVVGLFLTFFGSKYSSSTQVRWLDQLFEFYVQGNRSATSDNKVNEANVPTAQKWFAFVLGVPVYDRLRFNSLAGKTGVSSIDGSLDNRVKDYLKYPEVASAGVTYAQAYQAAQIAGSLPLNNIPGAWKSAVAASSLIDQSGTASSSPFSSGSSLFAGMNPLLLLGIIGTALYLIFGGGAKKHFHQYKH